MTKLERKIDEFIKSSNEKFDVITEKLSNIGRLEERMASFMGLAERIEERSNEDIRDLREQKADHEARLRALEAISATTTATNTARNKVMDGILSGYVKPILLGILGFLAVAWVASLNKPPQVTVTSAPTFNPPSKEAKP